MALAGSRHPCRGPEGAAWHLIPGSRIQKVQKVQKVHGRKTRAFALDLRLHCRSPATPARCENRSRSPFPGTFTLQVSRLQEKAVEEGSQGETADRFVSNQSSLKSTYPHHARCAGL